jgi:antitoxin HicB
MSKRFPIFIAPLSAADGGGFIAVVPDLRGCMSQADTEEEALVDARKAIQEWIDEATRLKRPIPEPCSAFERAAKERAQLQDTVAKLTKIVDTEVKELKARMEAWAEGRDESALFNELVSGRHGCVHMHDGPVH